MNILIIEPYFTGSHAQWAEGYCKHSAHTVNILRLNGSFWKWRMHGGAVTLARKFMERNLRPDLILATDMLDLTTFLALTRKQTADIPVAVYFHENQITYPWSPRDRDIRHKRDKHYGFINYATAMAADRVFFNSAYHRDAFFAELPRLLKGFPDNNELASVDVLRNKSAVLHLGLDLSKFDAVPVPEPWPRPLVLWNHRWEHDKNPEEFFTVLYGLADTGAEFDVAVLGENFSQAPAVFDEARKRLGERVVQYGFADSFNDYASWLYRADVLPVTSYQDNFGISIAEAAYCGCMPLLPGRLAYPEIFDPATRPELFYDGTDDLERKLDTALQNTGHIRTGGCRKPVAAFCWERMAPEYDAALERLL